MNYELPDNPDLAMDANPPTATVYRVLWDNGNHAAGDFGTFPTLEAAEAFGENWAMEMNALCPPADEYDDEATYEVVEEEEDMKCEKCERRAAHYPSQCSAPCSAGEHEVVATYKDYGYWRGQCSKCGRVWEVDSSG